MTGDLSDPEFYESLSDIPFSVGWPINYVMPNELTVRSVGAPPAKITSIVRPWAMVGNLLIVVVTLSTLVYLLQRFMLQFSVLTLFKVSLAFALFWGLGRVIGSFWGNAVSYYFLAVYFSPLAVGIVVELLDRGMLQKLEHKRLQLSIEQEFDKYENSEDAFALASKLDRAGDWETSVKLYRLSAERWPDEREYTQKCIECIAEKQALAQS